MSGEGDKHETKLAQQARGKGDVSYSYWADPSRPANSNTQPVRLAEGAAAVQQQQADAQQGHAASAWNAAGTFEERDVTEWAKQRLQELVVGLQSGSVRISTIRSIAGHANIWFIRGKKRSGFEFELDLAWTSSSSGSGGGDCGSDGSGGCCGAIKVPSASPDDVEDLHCEVTLDSAAGGDAAAGSAALQEARGLQQPLQRVLAQLVEDLRDK